MTEGRSNTSKHIGDALRAARLRSELTPADIGEMLNLKPAFITAIETLNLEALPAQGYTLGYVRAYAQAMGLSAEDTIADFRRDTNLSDSLSQRGHRLSLIERSPVRLPRGFFAALTIILSVGALGLWYGSQSASFADSVPVAEMMAPETDPEILPIADPNILTLKANAATWVEIFDASGQKKLSRIFVPGETYETTRGANITLSTRDGGALDLYVGGEKLKTLGARGERLTALSLNQATEINTAFLGQKRNRTAP